jgi:hypothetical protein
MPAAVLGQAVSVTLSLDTNLIAVGGVTTLRVWAQVTPEQRPQAEQIFSWYVDLLNTNGLVASATYEAMLKSASDNFPETSSTGFNDGSNRRGIYDTFTEMHPGLGVSNAVELMAVPVGGLRPGRTRFQVRAGTGVPELSADFLVASKGAGDPLLGGNYTAAQVDLQVAPCTIALGIARVNGGGPGGQLRLTFTPCPGLNHTVQFQENFDPAALWQALPGGPHNTGSLTITNTAARRFFRVAAAGP